MTRWTIEASSSPRSFRIAAFVPFPAGAGGSAGVRSGMRRLTGFIKGGEWVEPPNETILAALEQASPDTGRG